MIVSSRVIKLLLNTLKYLFHQLVVPHEQRKPGMTLNVLPPGIFGQFLELVYEVIDVLSKRGERLGKASLVMGLFRRLVVCGVSSVESQPIVGTDLLVRRHLCCEQGRTIINRMFYQDFVERPPTCS